MRIRYYILAIVLLLGAGVGASFLLIPNSVQPNNPVEINDIVYTLGEDFELLSEADYELPMAQTYRYSVVDNSGKTIAGTEAGLSANVHDAIANGDTIVDVYHGDVAVGKVFFFNQSETLWSEYARNSRLLVIAILVAMTAVCFVFFFMVNRAIVRPFSKMQWFAQRVATGDLDTPLAMPKKNAFGAFSESFDMMRDELKKAHEREYASDKASRELVASLSHDIQSPVTSILVIVELMETTTKDAALLKKLASIRDKATQINTLSSELFKSALEEQITLKTNPTTFSSDILSRIIEKVDYLELTRVDPIPPCLLWADSVRLEQVIDNIIINSYKYANTEIKVSSCIAEDGLQIVFRDFGPGIKTEELDLITSKYFRGEAAKGKQGHGLGLFIAENLITNMGGGIEFRNVSPGFEVMIWLKQAT